eukprot:CAMPEP_0182422920 /NCGR_PEP_ID=MMETSP1167-20130531/8768_1 /TAXON_ID=2988 /ORGANISM="Mallomonas Sp, Strain CCMP3275" /LENGTH=214 /DNA_ID=CAMNT_0024601405 /DNA_START=717 /DNA_END=1361 /DNA_ORIENTATION=+
MKPSSTTPLGKSSFSGKKWSDILASKSSRTVSSTPALPVPPAVVPMIPGPGPSIEMNSSHSHAYSGEMSVDMTDWAKPVSSFVDPHIPESPPSGVSHLPQEWLPSKPQRSQQLTDLVCTEVKQGEEAELGALNSKFEADLLDTASGVTNNAGSVVDPFLSDIRVDFTPLQTLQHRSEYSDHDDNSFVPREQPESSHTLLSSISSMRDLLNKSDF